MILNLTASVQIKKLHEDAITPTIMTPGSAGADLTAVSKRIDDSGYIEYGTGLAIAVPAGHVGLLFPRSSISKTSMRLCNSVGVIDSDYRGEVKLRFRWEGSSKLYQVGDRVGQLVIVSVPKVWYTEVDELDETVRGAGGFGSTDTQKES
jgi:dUTP pyrophosphatase